MASILNQKVRKSEDLLTEEDRIILRIRRTGTIKDEKI
jgi:hypothetical protein